MYLSKLQILGFKSFARKTELVFNHGITCIVGPNGCGKTNIVDAIRWVLGEQKLGILRIERMENLIFSGTRSLKPLGMAEVTLTIQNNKNILPIEYTEVEITRRLFRSGESEYLINRNPCRLKDITELFMDTGIGANAYSVMELGMVESILSERADERRRLLEEAAGITKYKHQRKAALRKLEATEIDLMRVNDIIGEIERTVASLKRHVAKARRAQRLSEDLRELEIKLAGIEYNRLLREMMPIKSEIEDKTRILGIKKTELSRKEADTEKLRTELLILEDELKEIQEGLHRLTEEIHQKEKDITALKGKIESLKEKIERYKKDKEEQRQRLSDLQNLLSSSQERLKGLKLEIIQTEKEHQTQKKQMEILEKDLSQKRAELEGRKKEAVDLLKDLSEKEKKREGIAAQLRYLEERLEKLKEDEKRLDRESRRAEEERERLSWRETSLKTHLKELSTQKDEKEKQILKLKEKIGRLKEEEIQLGSEVDGVRRRVEFLKKLIISGAGYSEGTKFLLQRREDIPGLLGPIGELISVEAKFRKAVEAALGEAVKYLVVSKTENAYQALEILKKHGYGGVTFLSLDKFSDYVLSRPPDLNPWADEVIRCKEEYRPLVNFLLGHFLIVEDLEAARKWIQSIGDSRVELVTLEGEVLSPWGRLKAGFYGRDETTSYLGRKEQIEELQARIRTLTLKLKEKSRIREEEKTKLDQLESEIKDLESRAKKLEEEFNWTQILSAQYRAEREKAQERLKEIKEEKKELDEEIKSIKETFEDIELEVGKLNALKREIDEDLASRQEKLEELEKRRNDQAQKIHETSLYLERLKGEERNLRSNIQRSETLMAEIKGVLENRDKELVEAEADLETLSQTLVEREKEMLALLQERNNQEEMEKDKQQRYHHHRGFLKHEEERIARMRRERDALADALQDLQPRLSELKMQIENLKDGMRGKYGCEPILVSTEEEIDEIEIKKRVEELRRKIDSLGPVNWSALEEYERESERLEFYKNQREDLLQAKSTLLKTINLINKTARERFYQTFNQIRKNFRRTFTLFFDGGEADLKLDPSEDPLEAEVKIVARPKGRELNVLNLLSGGEKALTAIALLFAIYQVKPSPFCILDEVDAPLDDVNVARFLRVLREFSKQTQFIVVTHNKLTMEVADYLYGVTMEEEGISKLVSVKLK